MKGELERLLAELEDVPEAVAEDVGRQLVQAARSLSPVRTGALRDGWGYSVKDGRVSLTNREDYAAFQEPDIGQAALERVKIDLSKHMG